jgi:hypothetical protein
VFCCLSVTSYFKGTKQPKKHKRKKLLLCCPSVTGCSKGKKQPDFRLLPTVVLQQAKQSSINWKNMHKQSSYGSSNTTERERGWQLAWLGYIQYTQ